MKRLKCFIGNLDGDREGLVIANSQREAARIAGTSLNDFREYWEVAPSDRLVETLEPMVLYTRPFLSSGAWMKGRCKK